MPADLRPPLYVDLDGTLLATDMLWESLIFVSRQHPRALPAIFWELRKGKAAFKEALAQATSLDASELPYRESVLTFLRQEKEQGRRIILATATHQKTAQAIAAHVNVFDDVLGTTRERNLRGTIKRDTILAHAQGAYEYLGDSPVDIPIWQRAARAHGVFQHHESWSSAVPEFLRGEVFFHASSGPKELFRAMRPYQWAKNILLFLPLFLSHTFSDTPKLLSAGIAFLSFSLTASAIYLLNDIFDIHTDRRHPEKRERPFARGTYQIPHGLGWSFILGITGFLLALSVSPSFALSLIGYLGATTLYTLWLKKLPIIDVLLIGFFYSYRIFAGAIATQTPVTDWLLAFSTFFFVSLGIQKRYSELLRLSKASGLPSHGRGYHVEDLPILLGFGLNSAFLSLLVFTFYLRSTEVTALYAHPSWLWSIVALLLIWIMRLWLLTHRGIVQDDPLLFTLRDRKSGLIFSLILLILIVATVG